MARAQPDTGEHIVLAHGTSSAVACELGVVTLSSLDDGSVRVDFSADMRGVLLRVTEAIELHDGDLIAAGDQWLSFEAGVRGGPARLHLLDAAGETQLTFTLRGSSLTLGRKAGDIVLPKDRALSELHLQLLMRDEGVFLQDLASANGTWTVVRPGESLPTGSTVAVGSRLIKVSTPPPVVATPGAANRSWAA